MNQILAIPRTLLGRALRPLKRMKRRLVNYRGDGVHSPYAFHIIHRIINCPYSFYCFEEIRQSLPKSDPKLRKRLRLHEAVFRLLHHHGQGEVMLYARPDGLLGRYLQHLRPSGGLSIGAENSRFARIVIVESLSLEEVELALDTLYGELKRGQELLLITYTRGENVQVFLQSIQERQVPWVTFDFLDLQLWVWRETLTPGRYKGIIK